MVDPGRLRSRVAAALPFGTRRRDAAETVRRVASVVSEAGSGIGEALGPGYSRAPVSPRSWLVHHHRVHETDLVRRRLVEGLRARAAGGRPGRLLVLVDDRAAVGGALEATGRSLDAQWSDDWESLAVGDDAALDEALRSTMATDPTRPVTILRAGDRLRPDLVARVMDAFWEDASLAMVHWDEAVGGPDELRFRPGWSPELLLSANAWGRCFAMRASRLVGFDASAGDAAWWAALLGAGMSDYEVRRLTRVGVTTVDRHDPVPEAARSAVAAELERRSWPADPVTGGVAVRIEWSLPDWPKVSIVVPSRHSRELLGPLLASLRATDYPHLEVVIVDNSGHSGSKDAWYAGELAGLDGRVLWWDGEPFNYSAVNNHGAANATGDVLVFMNDDTEARSPRWLRQLVGWASRPEIGTVGAQLLDPDGLIQHGGVVMGMDSSAGHLFAGGRPGADSLLGGTQWVRNVVASTAACVAVRREVFDACGGFDERFVLCGSDVVLGIDALVRGWRNVVVPDTGVLHMESATRGRDGGVHQDLFASWWRYQRWLSAGDPYFSPSLSLEAHWPTLRPPGEPPAAHRMLAMIDRPAGVFRQEVLEETARGLALAYQVGESTVDDVEAGHRASVGRHVVKTLNWVLPPFDNPFYGGLATIVRIAEHLSGEHGVRQRFVICDREQTDFYRSALAAGAPSLGVCDLVFLGGDGLEHLDRIPPADAVVATMWTTAYVAASAPGQRRRFYLIQDHEPTFYPAGTLYALAEETYRLGLYGICNTEPIHTMYTGRYGGSGMWFLPAVDRGVFFPPAAPRRAGPGTGEPVRVFVYARPGHWRNCWEIAQPALQRIKELHGDRVHIVTAGSWASPEDLGGGIEHLGLLDVRSTGELYRRCDVGVALTVSEHPSYLPGELMACGVPVVTFDLPEAEWIVRHRETGMRARQTVTGVYEAVDALVADPGLRSTLAKAAPAHVDAVHSDWDGAIAGVWDYLCDPG